MEMLREVDPEGVATRRKWRLQRRRYFNKVITGFLVIQLQ